MSRNKMQPKRYIIKRKDKRSHNPNEPKSYIPFKSGQIIFNFYTSCIMVFDRAMKLSWEVFFFNKRGVGTKSSETQSNATKAEKAENRKCCNHCRLKT